MYMNLLIILGNKLQKNGEMDTILINRLKMGQRLYNTGNYNLIVVSGGKVQSCAHTEAYKMKKYLVDNCRIPANKIIMESRSKDTIENAKMCLRIIEKLSSVKRVQGITVISSKFHIRRVKLIFNHFFKNTKNTKKTILYLASADAISGADLKARRYKEQQYYDLFYNNYSK